jgi:hypothetical protein
MSPIGWFTVLNQSGNGIVPEGRSLFKVRFPTSMHVEFRYGRKHPMTKLDPALYR